MEHAVDPCFLATTLTISNMPQPVKFDYVKTVTDEVLHYKHAGPHFTQVNVPYILAPFDGT